MKKNKITEAIIKVLKTNRGLPLKSYEMMRELEASGITITDITLRKYCKKIQMDILVKYLIIDEKGFYISRKKADMFRMIGILKKKRNTLDYLVYCLESDFVKR